MTGTESDIQMEVDITIDNTVLCACGVRNYIYKETSWCDLTLVESVLRNHRGDIVCCPGDRNRPHSCGIIMICDQCASKHRAIRRNIEVVD